MTEPWSLADGGAKHVGVAQSSIYRWIGRAGLPAHKIGRLLRATPSWPDEEEP